MPIIPPSVARFDVEVSGPKPSPKRLAARLRSSCTTPGSTRTRRASTSIASIVFMCREVSITSAAPAGGLAGQARAAAARDDRHAEPRGDRHRGRDVVRRAREDDREWLDRVQAGVGREQVARVGVRAYLSGQLPLERGRELLHDRKLPAR